MAESTATTEVWASTPKTKPSDRDTMTAIKRGMLGCCPACGSGKLFRAYLKPVDNCAACGEDLSHQRADDLPAYLVIVIVGTISWSVAS